MSRYALAKLAQTDLDDIWDHIAKDSPDAADQFTLRLYEVIRTIAREPGIGRKRPEFEGGCYRSFATGNYIIFYEPYDTHIEISRILHGSRNLPTLFGN